MHSGVVPDDDAAMAAALEGKEVAIEELSEQLAERVEEVEKR